MSKKDKSHWPVVRVSVRELVAFVLRTGGLGREAVFVGPRRALEGARAHQRIQKSRPADYEAEVFLSRDVATEKLILRVSGRIDGLARGLDRWEIEEIKTLTKPHDGVADELHWAQAKIYGAMLAASEPKAPENFAVVITYLELATGKISQHREVFSRDELEQFWKRLTEEYLEWAEAQAAWEAARNESIAALAFPFAEYRQGQRALAVAVYRVARDGKRLLAEAPTGIGKTVSVLYPAVKALGEGKARKIFYLTARTIGRAVAQDTVRLLREKGLRLRAVTLTARDKICFKEGESCDALECPYATEYYSRVKGALRDGFKSEGLDRGGIEALGRRHGVCPFELSLDLARWADLIICDYNYAFDPSSFLRRFFEDDPGGYVFLVDEAHNLPERAREMFSAELTREKLDVPEVSGAWVGITRVLDDLKEGAAAELPKGLVEAAQVFLSVAEARLARNEAGAEHDRLLEKYFEVSRFLRTAEVYDKGYATIVSGAVVRLFCADPTAPLKEALKRAEATVFFSATLSPLEYFTEIFGGGETLRLASPFPEENLAVVVDRKVETTLKRRAETAGAVAKGIVAACSQRVGNYLVFFSSHQYLQDVLEKTRAMTDAVLMAQAPQMGEREREDFLKAFSAEPARTQIGFAVLGGIFGEGIDLVGDRLIGAVVVGVGLPQICLERDLISERFAARGLDGYDFAYRFPGMNRVLQSAGRVIRTETDRGFVLLMDRRFAETRYQTLMPPHWKNVTWARDEKEVAKAIREFWA